MKLGIAVAGMLLAASASSPPSAHGQNTQPTPENSRTENARPVGALALNQAIERQIGPGQTDVFTVQAPAGAFLHVQVQKEGVNLVATLAGPDGRTLMVADDPPYRAFGAELVSAIAESAGEYQIKVSKSPRTSESGSYRIELTALRTPTDADQDRLQAETLFYAAVQNERSQGKENRVQAIAGYRQAADLWEKLHDDDQEALSFYRLAATTQAMGDFQEELAPLNRALPLWRTAGDPDGEATTLTITGYFYRDSGKADQALDYYNKALPLERAVGDRETQAMTLQAIGTYYYDAGDGRKAFDYYNQALALRRALGDRRNIAYLLTGVGLSDQALGENGKALDCFNEALTLDRELNDRFGESNTLNNIGFVYRELGDYQKALDNFSKALPLIRAIGDRHTESADLNNIGLTYYWLGAYDKALDYASQSLLMARANGDHRTEALVLTLMGMAYAGQKQWRKALDFDNRVLLLVRGETDRVDEAWTLVSIGETDSQTGQRQEALRSYVQALRIAQADANLSQEAVIFADLMAYWQTGNRPALAIFFGKEAVNFFQQMRSKMQGVDDDVQKSFLTSNDDCYHRLANLLIDQGRLAEAQQVLDLLKVQEYNDYVRGDAEKTLRPLSLTSAETQAEQDYQKSTAQLVAVSGNGRI
jgi:tetratricopeptide (TPR) repeat protein